MFVFSLKPIYDKYSYLSVSNNENGQGKNKLFINNTSENYPRLFITSQIISHEYYPLTPSEIYCPDANGFINADMPANNRGNRDTFLDSTVAPKDAPKYYIMFTGFNTCFVFTNPNKNTEYLNDVENNYLLTATTDGKIIYSSSNSFWPNEKLWFIEFYE